MPNSLYAVRCRIVVATCLCLFSIDSVSQINRSARELATEKAIAYTSRFFFPNRHLPTISAGELRRLPKSKESEFAWSLDLTFADTTGVATPGKSFTYYFDRKMNVRRADRYSRPGGF